MVTKPRVLLVSMVTGGLLTLTLGAVGIERIVSRACG